MNEKEWKRFLQNEMDKEMEEIDGILEKMESDPDWKDVTAPKEMHDKLFEQIHANKAEESRLSEEEKELINLGKVYKKRRKWNKVLVLVAAAVCALAIGVTSMGGPAKVIQKVQGMMDGREQIHMDTEEDRVEDIQVISEVEAYQEIEDEFGFYPVTFYYLPEGMEFVEFSIDEVMQQVRVLYGKEEKIAIYYTIYPNYRDGSVGSEIEENLVDKYTKTVCDVEINIKEYYETEKEQTRWSIEFQYQNVQYFLRIFALEKQEVEKIVENLYFSAK